MDGASVADAGGVDNAAAPDTGPVAEVGPVDRGGGTGGSTDSGALDATAPVDVPAETAPDTGGLPAGLKAIMITDGAATPTPGDTVMRDRLKALGFVITLVRDADVTTPQAMAMDLVVISSSAESAPLGTKVTNVTIPVLSIENGEYPMLKMSGAARGTDWDMTANQTSVTIKMPTHELAAGLTGTVKVSSKTGDMGWGVPSASAIVVATMTDNPAHIMIFGYEKGAQMVGMTAPARRAGYAIREDLAANLTAEGGKLFDAAVTWVMGK
jgi:hypothetical protein